jgi:pyruvate/2-oxoglutarate dehydrogenase complex dihydrolipoamide dehydrogenase (E3) component
LFGSDTQTISYSNIATTVFTPLELGTVGLTEDEAIDKFGKDKIDCYLSAFAPLEWTIIEEMHDINSFSKVVIEKDTNDVLGIHIAAPNAGEIIQGFAVAFRKGMKYSDLTDTVGIHPTVAEELVGMTVTKSSGEEVQKSSC